MNVLKDHYLYDVYGLYLGAVQSPANQSLPERSTVIAPPTPTDQLPYQVYIGGGWQLMAEVPTISAYDRNWDFGWIITVNAFRQRFTLPEQEAIEREQDNPDNPYRYTLRALMTSLAGAAYADLTDEKYTDAMQLLYALGILTPARIQTIHMTKAVWVELPQWRQAEFITKGYVPS